MSVIEKLINNPSEMLDDLLSKYFNNINVEDKTKISEFEIRFGRLNTISKYDFDSVISKLVDKGFKTDNIYGDDLLRISFEDQDELKDLRLEFEGNDIIEKICNNEMDTLEKEFSKVNLSPNISVIKKNFNKDNKFENKDYGFVVSYQFEETVGKSIVNENMKNYLKMKKYYRCLNRTEYTNKNYPFKIHMSLVKSSEYKNNSYRLYNSGLLQCPIKYEIEIEIDNKMIKNVSLDSLKTNLRYIIKNILCGIQNSNYPISYSKITNVKKEYLNLIGLDKNVNDIAPLDFIGYSTSILEMKHIQQDESYSDINIHSDYTVTDKADGERKLLLINSKGELNLLNSRLDVQYTGIKTNKKEYYNTIIDGEHIWNNEINMYAAFDIYYLNGNEENKEKTKGPIFKNPFWNETIGRYCLLSNLINDVEKNIDEVVSFTLKCKHFEIIKNYKDIFEKSKIILNSPKPYLTDGLIFTPASKCVGWMPDTEIKTLNKRYRWVYSLKWKPPEQNTVDFLVSVKDTIRYSGSKQYKRMDLYCGFKGFENPFEELLNFNKNSDIRSLNYKKNVYRKVLFKPSNPIFDEAYICNLFLKYHQNGKYELLTQENEIIEDDTIVEFSYDIDNKDNIDDVTFLWKPLRIRYDKTEEYRKQKTNFGNDYAVANSNWYYINNPITKDMISSGKDIPSIDNNDIYYNKSITISGSLNNLNKFHNDVKRKLINEFTIPGIDNYLMDFAVGKGGDLPKWIESKLKFVFGVDIFKDNIENKFDGACVRYFNYIINNYRSKYKKNIPDILFATADSSKLIKNGDATKYDHNGNPLYKNINTNIIDSVFGTKINDNYQSLKLYHGVGEKDLI